MAASKHNLPDDESAPTYSFLRLTCHPNSIPRSHRRWTAFIRVGLVPLAAATSTGTSGRAGTAGLGVERPFVPDGVLFGFLKSPRLDSWEYV